MLTELKLVGGNGAACASDRRRGRHGGRGSRRLSENTARPKVDRLSGVVGGGGGI